MSGSTFGTILRLTTFGESHGPAIGGVLDGVPAGLAIDSAVIDAWMQRRRPGTSPLVTARNEADSVTLLSGIFEGRTTGTPIGILIQNTDQHSADYENLRHTFRPGHADYTYTEKYGHRDHRGGGRASARETAVRVAAGAIAAQLLATRGITVSSRPYSVGTAVAGADDTADNTALTPAMEREIAEARAAGDTVGCVIECTVSGCPTGLGEPVFDKLQTRLAAAMLSIPAAKGFEYGMGFAGATRRGSEVLDAFVPAAGGGITTAANHSGGIQGGITNGQPIVMRVAFKPVATLLREVPTCDDAGLAVTLHARGRHDPCVVMRALPVVEAMAALTVADALLQARCSRL